MAGNTEQIISINRPISIEELYAFMQQYWDTDRYGDFMLDYRNRLSSEMCIFLPATKRFMIMICTSETGVFHKQNCVSLSVVETPAGMEEELKRSFPTGNLLFGAIKVGRLASIEKEKNKLAESRLTDCTNYMKHILSAAGLL